MKPSKPPTAETPSHRRSQPVRQTRTNPPRSSANAARAAGARDSLGGSGGGPLGDQPIDIFPAITHFADTIAALPKELVRHFTLLKEVDAKIFAPEDQLFKLVSAARSLPIPEPRTNDASSAIAPGSAPMSAQGSSSGIVFNQRLQPAPSTDEPNNAVFDPSNLHRRQMFRQTAFKIQEMLVSLEEKNHVLSTANEALQRQLARVEDVWPYLENEFSDEAKWGSTTHWAYPENRNGKSSQADRSRRDATAAISAAAQALVDQAAARSDARKQAVQAKKSHKNQSNDSDAEDHDGRNKDGSKKSQSSKVRKPTDNANVGLGISTVPPSNGNPPQKRRKIEKEKVANNTNGGAPMERSMSAVFGNNTSKAKPASPRETPVPEVPKKRKALPTSSGQSKKKNGVAAAMSPSATSSPVLGALPETKAAPSRPSPAPGIVPPRPTSSRARKNSIQSNSENGKNRPPSSAANKPNGIAPSTPDLGQSSSWPRLNSDPKPGKEVPAVVKTETSQKEPDRTDTSSAATPSVNTGRKESKVDETDRKSESAQPLLPSTGTGTVTTKSGRASKPSTPALPALQETPRSRTTRNAESAGNGNGNGNGKKAQQKKGTSVAPALVPRPVDETNGLHGDDDDDDGDIDADEPTYCYCNSVSYGEMVACDSVDCAREWFHLACVGLKVAPSSKTKWYCEDCKERLKLGSKKATSR